MKKYAFLVLLSASCFSQDIINEINNDSLAEIFNLNEVTVSSVRAKYSSPISFTNISKSEIQKINLAQDIPILLKNTPSAISHSDTGSGIGYTSIRIRGSDQTRLNVTINGVPIMTLNRCRFTGLTFPTLHHR